MLVSCFYSTTSRAGRISRSLFGRRWVRLCVGRRRRRRELLRPALAIMWRLKLPLLPRFMTGLRGRTGGELKQHGGALCYLHFIARNVVLRLPAKAVGRCC